VELKESRARADLFETSKPDGSVSRVGWIVLDNFYGDQDKKTISATEDVAKLLDRLMAEKMESLVIDLRGNPGGYLEEGVALSGLFLKSGPVVQERDARGRMTLKKSRPTEAKYNGPLVVLTDRYSASASEIFAAAMQDRGRAVVVGDHATFGKGTVQAVLDVGDYLPAFVPAQRAGSVKLTIRKFYRIAGGSTQLKGVVPDIILPSRLEASALGEDSMKGALEYDTMDKLPYEMASSAPLPLTRLKQSSEARLLIDPEFGHIREDYQRLKSQNEKNEISLDLEARRQEWLALEESAARRALERKDRLNAPVFQQKAYRLTVDNLKETELVPLAKVLAEEKGTNLHDGPEILAGGDFPLGLEPVKCETLNIARDLVEVSASPKETARR
jgi:carboxyl-terminal processing protease